MFIVEKGKYVSSVCSLWFGKRENKCMIYDLTKNLHNKQQQQQQQQQQRRFPLVTNLR